MLAMPVLEIRSFQAKEYKFGLTSLDVEPIEKLVMNVYLRLAVIGRSHVCNGSSRKGYLYILFSRCFRKVFPKCHTQAQPQPQSLRILIWRQNTLREDAV